MKTNRLRYCAAVLAIVLAAGSAGVTDAQRRPQGQPDYDEFYELGPDSLVRRGVPKGTINGPFELPTAIFPGTGHDYWVYVPAQYDERNEVSLMVFNDGETYLRSDGYYRAVNVLDNLIYRGDIPVMIAVFVDPGRFIAGGASNRSEEYNSLDDRYARVIVDELLPRLYDEYRISRDPDRHGIAGWSSGAIAAFTVAWERPDHFRKVLNGIGTFVDLDGGHVYPEKIRASEKKPIRLFMIDGRNDNRGLSDDDEYDVTRDWFYQNVRLKERAG